MLLLYAGTPKLQVLARMCLFRGKWPLYVRKIEAHDLLCILREEIGFLLIHKHFPYIQKWGSYPKIIQNLRQTEYQIIQNDFHESDGQDGLED